MSDQNPQSHHSITTNIPCTASLLLLLLPSDSCCAQNEGTIHLTHWLRSQELGGWEDQIAEWEEGVADSTSCVLRLLLLFCALFHLRLEEAYFWIPEAAMLDGPCLVGIPPGLCVPVRLLVELRCPDKS